MAKLALFFGCNQDSNFTGSFFYKLKNLNKHRFFSYALGAVAPRFFSFIFIPLFSHFLSQKDLGSYDLLITSISLFAPLLSLSLGDACYRFSYNANQSSTFNIVKTAIFFGFCLHFLLLIGTCLFLYFYPHSIDFLSLLVVFTSSFFLLFQSFPRVFQRIQLYAYMGIINPACILCSSVLLFHVYNKNLTSIKLAIIISNLFALLVIVVKIDMLKLLKKGIFDSKILKILLQFSLPLVLNTVGWWLVFFSNRFIITWALGIEANAIYAVANKIPSILFIANSIFILSLQDFVFEKTDEARLNFDFTLVFKKQFIFQFTLAFVILASSKTIISLLFPAVYGTAYQLSPLIFLGIIFTNFASFWGVFFSAKKETMRLLRTTLVGGLLNIIFTLFFIRSLALYAPALGTCLGFLAIWIIRIYQLRRDVIINFDKKMLLNFSLLFMFFSYSQFFSSTILDFFTIILSCFVFIFYHFDLIKTNFKRLKIVIFKP